MVFKVALVGRPNVGKSSLFNNICNRSARKGNKEQYQPRAIVADFAGVTRDLLYKTINFPQGSFTLIDSPGQIMDSKSLHLLMEQQAGRAYKMANLLLLVCDGKEGLTAADKEVATKIYASNKKCILLVNKMDHAPNDSLLIDFYSLGLPVIGVSAQNSSGIKTLLKEIEQEVTTANEKKHDYNPIQDYDQEEEKILPAIALLGCPNAGKSTLANLLLKEEKQLVHNKPGSTRDSVFLPFTMDKFSYKNNNSLEAVRNNQEKWVLIDTAGIRRKSKVNEDLEQLSVRSAINAIELSDLVIYIIDAKQGLRHQDRTLLHLVEKAGKGLVIAVNKADLLDGQQKKDLNSLLKWDLAFIDYASVHFISAKKNKGVAKVLQATQLAYRAADYHWGTATLNKILQKLISSHPPPLRQGKRSNLRYANQINIKPPHLMIHGKRLQQLSSTYKKYLRKSFSRAMELHGVPLKVSYKTDANPYDRRV